jgi:hypothetical protein
LKYVYGRTERIVYELITFGRNNPKDIEMKKLILAAAISIVMTGTAFAQTTGPAGQQDSTKAGMANPSNTGTNSMSNPSTGGTTGMSQDSMKKDGMSNSMNKGAESKDGDGMAKGGMKK